MRCKIKNKTIAKKQRQTRVISTTAITLCKTLWFIWTVWQQYSWNGMDHGTREMLAYTGGRRGRRDREFALLGFVEVKELG